MKCRLYVDEVGNPDLGSSNKDDHRFLCLAGVVFDLNYVERYSTWRYDPYHYCQEVLIERYRLFLDIEDKLTFGDEIIKLLEETKFFRYNGRILGYGAKKLP